MSHRPHASRACAGSTTALTSCVSLKVELFMDEYLVEIKELT